MSAVVVVADSGPIIHLSRVGLLDLLPALYGSVVVPRAVFNEVVRDGAGQPGFLQFLQIGESAAISIAYSKKARIKGR